MDLDSIDLYNPETQEDWFPAYETLLREAPVYQIPDSTIYVISKYEDILRLSVILRLFPISQNYMVVIH